MMHLTDQQAVSMLMQIALCDYAPFTCTMYIQWADDRPTGISLLYNRGAGFYNYNFSVDHVYPG